MNREMKDTWDSVEETGAANIAALAFKYGIVYLSKSTKVLNITLQKKISTQNS